MSLKPRRVDFDKTWSQLLDTVEGIITCGRVERSVWNDRFSDVYALCVAYPEPLGDRLYGETKQFLENHVEKLYQELLGGGEENLLTCYHRNWQQFSKGSTYLNQLYGYLNAQFIKKQKYSEADLNYGGFGFDHMEQMLEIGEVSPCGEQMLEIGEVSPCGEQMLEIGEVSPCGEQMLEIGELALDTWKRLMIMLLKDTLQRLILQEIHRDHCGQTVNYGVLHGVINSLVTVEEYKKQAPLKLYEDLFETTFLQETGRYYHQEALKLLDVCTCSEYMEKVIQKLNEEDLRSRKFLHPSSYSKVKRECEQRMMADHLQFLHGECREMVQKEKRQDLRNMYRLLSPIQNGLGVLVSEVEEHIKQVGLELVISLQGQSVPVQFVESMLEIHMKYLELIQIVFNGDKQFAGALDKACAAAINYKSNPKAICKFPEWVAKYCDSLLKKSTKGISESEIDDKLSRSITVFKYLDDKDVFQRFYARMLAKRLIYAQSQSMDAEEAMINRLKQACGYEFTNKLHRMFTDMTISTDLNSKFDDFLKKEKLSLGVNFSILVLQAGAWPIGQSNLPSFAIPQQLETSVRRFEQFYNESFNGRKLTWMHSLCSAELKLTYLKKPYFVTMGMFHMALLLPFNSCDSLNFKDLLDTSQLPHKELVKHLQALRETKVITAEDEEIGENTIFYLNMNYSNKRTKFKIVTAFQKETQQEVENTHMAVDEDRKMYLQAAIVRIMKARKILKHNILIQEVISQSRTRFTPSVSMIKKCIESLIEKQYIERTPNSSDEYSYVA
ncbi:Cullin-2 [Lamellibrachia satsuma]|nr:Cullin-2 [Lamellibrachia satsuma]